MIIHEVRPAKLRYLEQNGRNQPKFDAGFDAIKFLVREIHIDPLTGDLVLAERKCIEGLKVRPLDCVTKPLRNSFKTAR